MQVAADDVRAFRLTVSILKTKLMVVEYRVLAEELLPISNIGSNIDSMRESPRFGIDSLIATNDRIGVEIDKQVANVYKVFGALHQAFLRITKGNVTKCAFSQCCCLDGGGGLY